MRPDDRCGSRHSRHPPAFMSTPHRAQVAARVVSDAGTTPTIRTWQHPGGQPDGESCPYVAPFLPVRVNYRSSTGRTHSGVEAVIDSNETFREGPRRRQRFGAHPVHRFGDFSDCALAHRSRVLSSSVSNADSGQSLLITAFTNPGASSRVDNKRHAGIS